MRHDLLKILVTGGAGFIGSHLVDRLMKDNHEVTVIDNLSNGNLRNIESWLDNEHFKFIKGDLKEPQISEKAAKDAELVFHLAANPEVRVGETDPSIHFEENLIATFRLLEVLRKQGSRGQSFSRLPLQFTVRHSCCRHLRITVLRFQFQRTVPQSWVLKHS